MTTTVPHQGVRATARGGAQNIVGSVVGMVLSLALVVLVTREYGAPGAGVFFTGVAVFTIVGTVAKLGSETGLVFTISRDRSTGRYADVVPTIHTALWPVLLLSVVVSVALIGVAALLPGGGHHTADGSLADVLTALAPFLVGFTAVQVLTGATRGYGRMGPTNRDVNVLRPLLQLVLMAAVVAGGGGLVALSVAWGVPLYLTTVSAAVSLMRLVLADPRPDEAPRPGLRREFWRYASVRGFAQTLQTTQDRIGIVMVGAFAGATAAGVYVALSRIVGAVNLLIYAVGQALNPEIGALLAVRDAGGAERVVQRITAWTMLLVWPMAILLLTHGDVLLGLFGKEFPAGTSALELLAVALVIATPFCHLDNVLLMGGRARLSLYNVMFSLVLMTVLYAVLTPAHGLMGAAWAWSIGLLAYNLIPWFPVRRTLGIRGLGHEALYVLPPTIGALCAASLGRVALGDSWPATIATGLATGLVFVVGAWQYRGALHLDELAVTIRRPGR